MALPQDPRLSRLALAVALAAGLVLAACDRRDAADEAADATPLETMPPDTMPTDTPAIGPPADATAAEFARMDADADQVVTPAEHEAGARAMFETMDADDDGTVTAAEMDAAGDELDADARMTAEEKIAIVDGNDDGVLSAEEHAAGADAMFVRMDTDHDGRLSATELQVGHETMLGGEPPPDPGALQP